MAHRQN